MKIYKNRFPFHGIFFFVSLSFLFLFLGFNILHYLLGAFFIICSILVFGYKSGIQIEANYKIRSFFQIYNFTYGKWEEFEVPKYIVVLQVKRYKPVITAGFYGQTPSNKRVYQVKLYFKNKSFKPMKIISTNRAKALVYAEKLSNMLKIEMVDGSSPETQKNNTNR